MAPRALRAPTQEPSIFSGIPYSIAVLIYWWDIYVLGLRFLAQPAVTSASEVLTQTYRSSRLVQWLACWAMLHERVKYRTSVQNVGVPIPSVRWYLRGDTVDPTRASLYYLSLFQFLRFKNKLWNRVGTLRSRFSSALGTDCRLSRTPGGGRNRGRDPLRVGGWWFAPKSTVPSKISLPPSRLTNFLVRRARVRDDSGRSPQIELEPERSFDGPLSGQSVYEQTSGVLRHTESVRGDKVQEQDWVSDIQVRTFRTLADARSNDPARSQASV